MFFVLQPDVPITLEVLHLVFSAFGLVHKIATFEKQAGLQALVQFDDTPTAELVDILLDHSLGCRVLIIHVEVSDYLDDSAK